MPSKKSIALNLALIAGAYGTGAAIHGVKAAKVKSQLSIGVDESALQCAVQCVVAAWPAMAKEEINAVVITPDGTQNMPYSLTVQMMREQTEPEKKEETKAVKAKKK